MSTAVRTSTPPTPAGAPPAVTGAAAARAGTSARYWVCLAALGLAAVAVGILPARIGVFLQKDPVALRKPLQLFDLRLLGPRYERHPGSDQIPPLSHDMIDSLGTSEYVQLLVTDTMAAPDSTSRVAKVFITYYTGQPDMVPHVPDECYLAGGYDKVWSGTLTAKAVGVGAPHDQVPVRVIEFRAPASKRSLAGGDTTTIMYFFHVNNEWTTTRDGVRTLLTSPFKRFAYYAKVEVYFSSSNLARNAGRDESLKALGPLLERLMPALYEHHLDLSKFGGDGEGVPPVREQPQG
jgi:hypothetical protein